MAGGELVIQYEMMWVVCERSDVLLDGEYEKF